MSTPFATGDHDRGWLPPAPPHIMVRQVVTVEAVQDLDLRQTMIRSILRRVAEAHVEPVFAAGERDWELGPVTYRPMIIPRDPEHVAFHPIGHPWTREYATEDTVDELAATLAAVDPDEIDGQWVFLVYADVIWGALRT